MQKTLNIGNRIKRLRIASNLTQDELALRADLTKGFISLLERNRTSISIDALAQILVVFGISLAEFFKNLESGDESIVFRKKDRVLLKGAEHEEVIELLIPGAQAKTMDPVLVTLDPGKQSMDQGHEGEEFGMVLAGSVVLEIEGGKPQKVRKGECFYFRSDRPHTLTNNGKIKAKILWVVSPPVFH